MTNTELRIRLIHAVTRYDERESRKRHYNVYALGQYLKRVDEVCADIRRGAPARAAICAAFNGRLLNHMLKAAGEKPASDAEARGDGHWSYAPVTGDAP